MIGIVDASVAAMRFLPEKYSENAVLLLIPEYDLVAPELIHLEVGSALLKAMRWDEVPITDSVEVLSALLPAALRMLPSTDHIETAFEIARGHGGSIYDALYIALARTIGAPLITGDRRLAAVAGEAKVRAMLIADGPPVLTGRATSDAGTGPGRPAPGRNPEQPG